MSGASINSHQDLLDQLQERSIIPVMNNIMAARLIGPPPVEGSGLKPAGAYDDQESFNSEDFIVISKLKVELGEPASIIPNMAEQFRNTAVSNNQTEPDIDVKPNEGPKYEC